jgi:CBS domain-containing protein
VDFQLNLDSETVAQAYPSDPICVEPSVALREAIGVLREHRTGALLVTESGKLVGIFTERDALRLMAADTDWNKPLEGFMIRNPETISCDSTVGQAIEKMAKGKYRRLPIVDEEGRPKGICKVSAIIHYLAEHFPQVIYTLPPAPHSNQQEREGA